jgi:hypothetical protein
LNFFGFDGCFADNFLLRACPEALFTATILADIPLGTASEELRPILVVDDNTCFDVANALS